MPVIPALRPEQHNAVALAPVVIGEVPSAGGVKPHQRLHPARSVKVRPLIAEAQMHFDHAATDGLDIQHAGVAAQVTRDPFAAIAFDLELAIRMHGPVIERALARRMTGDVAPPARLAGDDGDVGAHVATFEHGHPHVAGGLMQRVVGGRADDAGIDPHALEIDDGLGAVSYTHLTLPTIYPV